jgi:uncharacterized protein YjcR
MKTALELLRDEVIGELPPEGWYTTTELVEKLGVKRAVIENLIERKNWKCKKYRTCTKDGKLILANHYYTGKL